MIAVSYERVSSEEQAREGFSLEVQNEKNISLIKSQGWDFGGSYIDPGKSGKNLNRPDMKRLLADVNKNVVHIVVVHKLDRLTRNIGDLHSLLMLFDKKEIRLVSVSENIDTSSAMGRMFVYMLGIFAQWYRENLSEEVYKGVRKRAENGLRMTGSVPFGYSANKDLTLVISEPEARVVRQMFSWYISGKGFQWIAHKLNTEGIDGTPVSAPKGGVWRHMVIGTIISNWSYIGATHWKAKGDDESDRIIVKDRHEAIVSEDVFMTAQRIIRRKGERSMSRSGFEFPFSAILKCAACGRSLTGRSQGADGKKYRYYVCSGNRFDNCPNPRINELKINELFLELLTRIKLDTPDSEKKVDDKNPEKEIKKTRKLIEESAAKKMNYTRAMGSGKLDFDMYEKLMDEENSKITKWENELSQLEQFSPTSSRTRKDFLSDIIKMSEKWDSLSYETRKIQVQNLFSAIVLMFDSGWKIMGYRFAD
jgi:site-specific DNA recombinase